MNPKELRIGNYVTSKGQITNGVSPISKIVGIQANGKTNASGVNWVGRTEANDPIPLTEDWLINFGFDWDGVAHYVKDNIGITKNGSLYGFNRLVIKHIHQLQNLYFALTQKELEL